MTRSEHRRGGGQAILSLLAAAVLAVTAVACSSDSGAQPPAPTTTSTTEAAVTTTTEPSTGPVAPLTGLRVTDDAAVARPALVAKIDNLQTPGETALPQAGLAEADVVFEEIVEGNITRLVGVFHSQTPGRIGPVRSARTTDVHLIPQLGRVLFVWSGGNDGVVAAVRGTDALINLGHDAASGAYSRDRSRRAPHNLFVDPADIWGRSPEDVAPPRALFSYRPDGAPNPATAEGAQGVDITWGGGAASSPVSWRWQHDLQLYTREQRGEPHHDDNGTQVSATNIVVLVTEYGRSAADSRSPEAHTVGSGEAFVYTHGNVIWGTWERTAEDQPAVLRDTEGQEIQLMPGNTWVELPRPGGVTTIR